MSIQLTISQKSLRFWRRGKYYYYFVIRLFIFSFLLSHVVVSFRQFYSNFISRLDICKLCVWLWTLQAFIPLFLRISVSVYFFIYTYTYLLSIYIYIYIYRVSQKKLCFTFLLISQLILIVERRVGYPQNWDGKRFLTICDSTFSVTWFTRKLTF